MSYADENECMVDAPPADAVKVCWEDVPMRPKAEPIARLIENEEAREKSEQGGQLVRLPWCPDVTDVEYEENTKAEIVASLEKMLEDAKAGRFDYVLAAGRVRNRPWNESQFLVAPSASSIPEGFEGINQFEAIGLLRSLTNIIDPSTGGFVADAECIIAPDDDPPLPPTG